MSADWESFFSPGKRTQLEVRGLKETQKKMEQTVRDLTGKPMEGGMAQATLWVQRDAKKFAPVDTGRLRASITPEVRTLQPNIVEGVVGSNVKYAPYVETGTRPHYPPIQPIVEWVHRKKVAGIYSVKTRRRMGSRTTQEQQDYLMARAVVRTIGRRGTKAHRYLQKAFEKNAPRIYRILGDTVAKIVEKEP